MKKLKPEFIDALTNFVYRYTKNLPANMKKIQTCIENLELQANDKGIICCITLVSDPKSLLKFTEGYTSELYICENLFQIVALADKDFIEV